jgi:DNA-binding response OmpR family regulator
VAGEKGYALTTTIDQLRAPRILIVDDDASLRLLCRVNLELEGYRVVEAQNLAEAEDALAGATVDLVLLDVHVGADDGLELMRSLRKREHTAAVVLFTGSAQLDPATRAEADGVLPKPFRLDQLFDVVRGLVRRSATGR